MVKPRRPMQVDPIFKNRIEDLQRKIMIKKGKKISYRELTAKIIKTQDFNNIEEKILNEDLIKIDIGIKFDGRFKK